MEYFVFIVCQISRVAEQGHKVIGCEYAKKSGSLFAKNCGFTCTETDAPAVDGKIAECKEVDVKIYMCDIFKFTR